MRVAPERRENSNRSNVQVILLQGSVSEVRRGPLVQISGSKPEKLGKKQSTDSAKIHKKTIKAGQTRTRERKECKRAGRLLSMCNRVLERQKKLRNQIFRALTASADVPSSVTETTDTTSTLPPPPPPLQKPTGIHYEDGNPTRAYIKQALGSFKDGDGDGRYPFQ
ncbi:hypothetical protein Tco_0703781 [Tanacetum coccineum]|uniref:Uncharacterized protein n=1 Tax=Tanacetum coccineum TaxID=301880 RepID=A0ABQ4Y0S1_9ASTR